MLYYNYIVFVPEGKEGSYSTVNKRKDLITSLWGTNEWETVGYIRVRYSYSAQEKKGKNDCKAVTPLLRLQSHGALLFSYNDEDELLDWEHDTS